MGFASVCVLSYQRFEYLQKMMNSLLTVDSGFPMEIIVNDDGSDDKIKKYLSLLARQGKISYLIQNCGKNRGIGEAVRNCFKIASGDYLFKVDTDLEFKEGWLRKGIDILQHPQIGAVSLFNYNHYDPADKRFSIITELEDCYIVTDFVSSIYGVRRETYEKYKSTLDTDGWHTYIQSQGLELAISKKDLVDNFGFGLFKSIYCQQNDKGELVTTKTYKEPLIFNT